MFAISPFASNKLWINYDFTLLAKGRPALRTISWVYKDIGILPYHQMAMTFSLVDSEKADYYAVCPWSVTTDAILG